MAITSTRRIPVAQEFVRIGFGEVVDDNAPFYSHEFLTQELTTTEVQAVLPVVQQYNAFEGAKVAAALERFRGKVSGWKFGCAGSPLLIAVFPAWTHQAEDVKPGSVSGTRISEEERTTLVAQMKDMFLNELGADKFEANDDSGKSFGAWWD